MTSSKKSASKTHRQPWWLPMKIIGGLFLFIAVVLTSVQLLLSPRFCTQLVSRYAPLLTEGDLRMSSAHVNVLRNFPRLTAQIDSLALTYQSPVCAGRTDTLACFDNFTLSMNPLDLLKGRLNVRTLVLDNARVKLEYYSDSTSNLQIIKPLQQDKKDSAQKDTSSLVLPEIFIKRLSLDDGAHIDYIKGKDTVSVDVSRLKMRSESGNIQILADARTYVSTQSKGNVTVPFSVEGQVAVSSDEDKDINLRLRDFSVKIATLSLGTELDIDLGDNIGLKGSVIIPNAPLQSLIDDYAVTLFPELSKIKTDASLYARLDLDGFYDSRSGALPAFKLKIGLPQFSLLHQDFNIVPTISLKAFASAPQGGKISAQIDTLLLRANGIDARVKCGLYDALGGDPLITADVYANTVLDTIGRRLNEKYDIYAGGLLKASVRGKFRPSQLNFYKISKTEFQADVLCSHLKLNSCRDSLDIYVDSLGIKGGMQDSRPSKGKDKKMRLVSCVAAIDSIYFKYKEAAHITGRNIAANVHSVPDVISISDTVQYNPLAAGLRLGSLFLEGQDSLALRLLDSRNSIGIFPSKQNRRIPVISLVSHSERIRAATGPHHFAFKDVRIGARAQMNHSISRRRINAVIDSVSREHPGWSPDSVARYIRQNALKAKLPDYLTEEDFRKADLKIDLGKSLMALLRKWSVSGKIGFGRSFIRTPAFPLRTSVTSFVGSFDNDKVVLDTLKIRSGVSRLQAEGSVSNLKRAMSRRGGALKLNLNLTTDTLSVNQILDAYATGQKNMEVRPDFVAGIDSQSDQVQKIENFRIVDSLSTSSEAPENIGLSLVIVPANIDARLNLDCRNILYSSLGIDSLKADLVMRHRCLQLMNARLKSQYGNVALDAFYSTKTKKDLLCGFDLSLSDISAGNVIALMPRVDTLLPVLKSFDGLLNCNVAATAAFDQKMNFLPGSVDGVMRISGKGLHFNENEQVKKIARKLLFRDPGRVAIDTMMVEGILQNGSLEIFPFILKMDRWHLALAGVQNLDMSYRYHISFIKSPLVVKFGANIYGNDFDNIKLKLGKAQYLNQNVPSFSKAVDETRLNLRTSIDKIFEQSIQQAIDRNRQMEEIGKQRQEQGYQRSVADEPIDAE